MQGPLRALARTAPCPAGPTATQAGLTKPATRVARSSVDELGSPKSAAFIASTNAYSGMMMTSETSTSCPLNRSRLCDGAMATGRQTAGGGSSAHALAMQQSASSQSIRPSRSSSTPLSQVSRAQDGSPRQSRSLQSIRSSPSTAFAQSSAATTSGGHRAARCRLQRRRGRCQDRRPGKGHPLRVRRQRRPGAEHRPRPRGGRSRCAEASRGPAPVLVETEEPAVVRVVSGQDGEHIGSDIEHHRAGEGGTEPLTVARRGTRGACGASCHRSSASQPWWALSESASSAQSHVAIAEVGVRTAALDEGVGVHHHLDATSEGIAGQQGVCGRGGATSRAQLGRGGRR